MAITKDKLAFALELGRRTRATVRQCEALLRYAGTLAAHDRKAKDTGVSLPEIVKFNRIVKRVHKLCDEIECEIPASVKAARAGLIPSEETDVNRCVPVFDGPVLKIRVPDGGEIDVPA